MICKRYDAKDKLGIKAKNFKKAQFTRVNVLLSQENGDPAANLPLLCVTDSGNADLELFCRISVFYYLT